LYLYLSIDPELNMNILKLLRSGFPLLWIGLLVQEPPASASVISVSGSISTNTTWLADTVKVTGDISINNGVTLTIPAGTYIESQGYYSFHVNGCILAVGTLSDSICFTVNDTLGLHDLLNPDGSWGGFYFVHVDPANDTSRLAYCKLQYCKKVSGYGSGGAIKFDHCSKVNISHCRISDNYSQYDGAGISCMDSDPVIRCNMIANNLSMAHGGGICYMGDSLNITNFSDNVLLRNRTFL
jgi:hypothetical protein